MCAIRGPRRAVGPFRAGPGDSVLNDVDDDDVWALLLTAGERPEDSEFGAVWRPCEGLGNDRFGGAAVRRGVVGR